MVQSGPALPVLQVPRNDSPARVPSLSSVWCPIRSQHFAQRPECAPNVIFLDDDAWPHLGHEFVLGDQMAMAAYQHQQYVKRSLSHGNGYAAAKSSR